MKQTNKFQKGFIQIPLLLIIIMLVTVVSAGTGYVLHKNGKLAPLEAGISNLLGNNKPKNPKTEEPKQEATQQNELMPPSSTQEVNTESLQPQKQALQTTPALTKILPPQSETKPKINIETSMLVPTPIVEHQPSLIPSPTPTPTTIPKTKQNTTTSNTQISELSKILDNLLAEKQRQNEIALQQLYADQNEMNQRIAPLQSELDSLEAKKKEIEVKKKEVGCAGSTDGPITMDQIIGSKAQQCAILTSQCTILISQMGIIVAKISGITGEYSAKLGITPTLKFTTQQLVREQHYEFYYNGYGSGSIYNTSNPAESYKIYCAYGKCDIYGN